MRSPGVYIVGLEIIMIVHSIQFKTCDILRVHSVVSESLKYLLILRLCDSFQVYVMSIHMCTQL